MAETTPSASATQLSEETAATGVADNVDQPGDKDKSSGGEPPSLGSTHNTSAGVSTHRHLLAPFQRC